MSDGFDDYVADSFAGIKQGASDIGRHAIADIGDKYQEVLMSDASISPPSGLTNTIESVSYEIDRPQNPVPLEPYQEPGPEQTPTIDMDVT